jgi:hypothetical protein
MLLTRIGRTCHLTSEYIYCTGKPYVDSGDDDSGDAVLEHERCPFVADVTVNGQPYCVIHGALRATIENAMTWGRLRPPLIPIPVKPDPANPAIPRSETRFDPDSVPKPLDNPPGLCYSSVLEAVGREHHLNAQALAWLGPQDAAKGEWEYVISRLKQWKSDGAPEVLSMMVCLATILNRDPHDVFRLIVKGRL